MGEQLTAEVTFWVPDDGERALGTEGLTPDAALGAIASAANANLYLNVGDRTLIVAVDQGRFVATALLGEKAFDLDGNPEKGGTEPFNTGGGLIEYPQRFIVTERQALEAVREFLRTRTVDPSRGWKVQSGARWG